METIGHTTAGSQRGGHYQRAFKEFICAHCGESFLSKASKALDCPNCRETARREYADEILAQKRRDNKARSSLKMWNDYRYEVLHDPDECAGLSRGARFAGHDMDFTLSMGHFTPGTRVLDRKSGLELVVIGHQFHHQALARPVGIVGKP